MKTKTFVMVCLLLGIGLTQLSAQPNGKNGTGSDAYWMMWGFYADVACDGQWVDYVQGDLYWHMVDHYKDGVYQWSILEGKGVLQSALTGEVFNIHELDKFWIPISDQWTANTFLKGDQGNHYMITWLFDGEGWHVTKFGCPGNEMNNGNK